MTKIRMIELAALALLIGAGAYGVITQKAHEPASPSMPHPAESRPTQATITRSVPTVSSAPSSSSGQPLPPESPDHAVKVECMRLVMDGMNALAKAEKEGRADQVQAVTLPSHCEKYLTQQ